MLFQKSIYIWIMNSKKNSKKAGKKPPMAERYPRTISKALFDKWQHLKRYNDGRDLVNETGKSRPIIDRAIKYGHCKDEELITAITNFFVNRLNREKAAEKNGEAALQKANAKHKPKA